MVYINLIFSDHSLYNVDMTYANAVNVIATFVEPTRPKLS